LGWNGPIGSIGASDYRMASESPYISKKLGMQPDEYALFLNDAFKQAVSHSADETVFTRTATDAAALKAKRATLPPTVKLVKLHDAAFSGIDAIICAESDEGCVYIKDNIT
ncbi:hypothetical protein HK405_007997, partial [Cladochytrium tenue]